MNILERADKLYKLVEIVGGRIESRKKLHKLVYLLQEVREDFDQDFVYLHYGVFSHTLASDLGFSVEHGLLHEVKEMPTGGYVITVASEEGFLSEDIDLGHLEIVSKLSTESPRFLEVLSTIVYLHTNGYRKTELKTKLKALKSELLTGDTAGKAYEFARELFQVDV